MKPKSKPLSIRALAAAVGVGKTAVMEWSHHPAWPFGAPPWPAAIVPRVRRWRDRLPKSPQRADPERDAMELALARERLETLGAINGRFAHKYIARDLYNRALISHIHLVRKKVEKGFLRDIPAKFESVPERDNIARVLRDAYSRFCADMFQTLMLDLVTDDDPPAPPTRNLHKSRAAHTRHRRNQ